MPKGLLQVLKERGVDTRGMKVEDMRKELASHEDYKNEKTKIEHFLNGRGHCSGSQKSSWHKFKLQQNAEVKYTLEEGYRLVWIIDHSSCHGAYAEDVLNAYKMNMKPGGKQPAMRNTVWRGKQYSMVFNLGVPKGLLQVLKERGVDTRGMKVEDMRKELASHEDYKNEKTKIEHYLNGRGHCFMLLPKFHCEINPIERCWAQAKRYVRSHTNYTIFGLSVTDYLHFIPEKGKKLKNTHCHF